ncbi:MAG: Diguanylate cyclase protein [Nocardioides sp.]|nr:Diguanylate cyclase protein [Nocardioides sp.]
MRSTLERIDARLRSRLRARRTSAAPWPPPAPARRDPLTGLVDRDVLLSAGHRLLAAGPVAVVVADLDGLKQVNDALGHAAGDRLLVETARRLRSSLSPDAVVARLGGDEFAAVVAAPDAHDAGPHPSLHDTLRHALRQPVRVKGLEVPASASVGIALSSHDGAAGAGDEDITGLLAAADHAMYRDKSAPARRGRPTSTPPEAMLADLRRALSDGSELRLHHQPQVGTDGRVVGFEVLVRWEHPEHGQLPASAFVPLAERHGLVGRLDELVIGQALVEHAVLAARVPDVRVAVNLSAHTLLDTDLAERLGGMLEARSVSGRQLTFEVSESATGLGRGRGRVHDELRRLGCSLSVQEFGGAHASLTALSHPLVREAKVHRRLVAGLDDPEVSRLLRGLVSAAHGLGIRVVAEGVETAEAARELTAMGCDALQGFWVCPPLAALDLVEWVDYWERSTNRLTGAVLPRAVLPGAVLPGAVLPGAAS